MAGVPSSSHGGSSSTELGYNQITASVNITDTLEATATALITASAITFSGATVLCQVFTQELLSPTGGFAALTLFEGSTEITRLCVLNGVSGAQVGVPVFAQYRFAPSAGSHTYKVCGWVASTTGTPQLIAGSGGTAGPAPAYIRFVTV